MLQFRTCLQWAHLLVYLCCVVPVLCKSVPVTHICSLQIDGAIAGEQKGTLKLSCQRQQQQTSSRCNLVVYYNSTVTPLHNKRPFGIPTYALPKLDRADLRSAAVNASEQRLNRTEPDYHQIMWPLLYFFGGPSCHVLFDSPVIRGVKLPFEPNEGTQLLVFGGGLSATLIGGNFSNNTAVMGVTALANSTLTAKHTVCAHNTVKKGCFYGSYTSQLFLDNVTIADNNAEEGAAMYLVNSTANLLNSVFANNSATAGGGAAYVKGGSSMSMLSSELINNTAPTGGAIAVYNAPFVSIRGCRFVGNRARSNNPDLTTGDYYKLGVGGAMYLEWSDVQILHTKLEGNKAVMDGGAVRLHVARLNISNSNLTDNLAYRHGGGMYAGAKTDDRSVNSTIRIVDCILKGNTAQANGGGLLLDKRAHTTIINSTFDNCKSWSEGDGVCTQLGGADAAQRLNDLRTKLVVDNVTFVDTIADGETDEMLFVGPFFNLTFRNTNLNRTSTGVVWRRRLCKKGEYVSPSAYCEACPSYTFSTEEAYPGHNSTNCRPAPKHAFAPGGAVLVALPGSWHGVNDSVPECLGCPRLVAKLDEIKRCPNPGACEHDSESLAWCHPDSMNSSRLTWPQYSNALCDSHSGYTGVLCGVCIKGFGTTSPFSCSRCLGAHFSQDQLGNLQVQQPGPAGISGLYFAYWFVLTCWLLLCVRFSVPQGLVASSKGQPLQATGAAAGATALQSPNARAASETIPEESAVKAADAKEQQQDAAPQHQQPHNPGQQSQKPKVGLRGSDDPQPSKAIDISKALMTYTQWAMLILNLPPSWLPWSSGGLMWSTEPKSSSSEAAATTHHKVPGAAGWSDGVLFGRSASLDCFLQAWGLLQGNTERQIVSNVFARTVASAIVVPFILFLSVLVLQLLIRMLRQPVLRVLVKLCGDSQTSTSRPSVYDWALQYLQPGVQAKSAASDVCYKMEEGDRELPRESSDTSRATSSTSLSSGRSASVSSLGSFGMSPSGKPGGIRKVLVDNIVATVLAISLFLYPTIARAAIGMLLCVRVSNESSTRWVLDVRLQCPTAAPYTLWGVAAVVLGVLLLSLCIAWPVGVAAVLVREAHRGNLLRLGAARASSSSNGASATAAAGSTAAHTTARLAVRYADYDVEYEALSTVSSETSFSSTDVTCCTWCWGISKAVLLRARMYVVLVWDSVLELHKLTLVFVSLCVMLHELHQLTFMILVLGSYMVLVLLVKPWRSRAVWRLQVSALALLLASCMGIGACTVNDALAYYSPESYMRYMAAIPWLIIAANLCYLVFAVLYLLRCVWRELPRFADVKRYVLAFHNKRIRQRGRRR